MTKILNFPKKPLNDEQKEILDNIREQIRECELELMILKATEEAFLENPEMREFELEVEIDEE